MPMRKRPDLLESIPLDPMSSHSVEDSMIGTSYCCRAPINAGCRYPTTIESIIDRFLSDDSRLCSGITSHWIRNPLRVDERLSLLT
mmetsp:Transcript_9795/g.23685  ORF Transcript_9795/g.23685 Transcript_9795/m.23685 type:complete len:86 (-) Transcript_9795:620-877(-)